MRVSSTFQHAAPGTYATGHLRYAVRSLRRVVSGWRMKSRSIVNGIDALPVAQFVVDLDEIERASAQASSIAWRRLQRRRASPVA